MGTVSTLFDGRMIRHREIFTQATEFNFDETYVSLAKQRMIYHVRNVVEDYKSFGQQDMKDVTFRFHMGFLLRAYRDLQSDLENSDGPIISNPAYADRLFEMMAAIGVAFSEDILPLEDVEMDEERMARIHRAIDFPRLARKVTQLLDTPIGRDTSYQAWNP